MVNGISDSLIASILYATGKKLYWKFRDPLKSAIDNTIVYFSKERGMELDRNRFEALLRGDIGEEEHNKFKSGEKFIDGQKLALQFAIFSGFYHDDENQILTISNEIFSYFKTAFTNELLRNPNESIINLNNILEIQFKISQTELDRLRKEVERFQKFLMEKEQLRIKYADFKISNSDFWETIKQQSEEDRLFLYYTNTDSSPVRLKDVVANDFYVINDKIDYQFFTILEECLKNQYSLIKIISRGGEGKSTYLYHIAKRCCSEYNVIILENFNKEILIDIESQLQFDESPKPFLFLLDNPSLFEDELIQSTPKLISAFRKYGLVIIIAEREFRYENFEDKIEFENNFNQVYEINYVAQNLKERIFNKLFSLFQINYDVPEYLRNDAKRIYFQDKPKSLSESTFAVIKEIVKRTGIKFIFDWVDWEKYTKEREPRLNELYLIIATFYQFGFSLPIDFCIKFLKDVNRRTIIKLISESYNHPIYMRRDHLFLRHETIATWYLNDSDNIKRMSLDLFDEFLNKIETEFDKDLVIWIYKHKEFQKSHLSKILDDERQISLLEKYIEKNNCELKCRT
ncbi:MAG: hypothetical protein H8D45_23795, partial [Bacteroidetes bacterium]|nr:hypothetical protein [Bacteroidota bacterium]